MSMTSLLFSPNGRIGPGAFWRGLVIVLTAGIVVQIGERLFIQPATLGEGPPGTGLVILSWLMMLIMIASWWATICVFVKRLHDSGKSGWTTVPIGIGWGLVFLVISMLIIMTFAGSEFSEFMQRLEDDPSLMQTSDFMPKFQAVIIAKTWLPLSLASLALSIGLGFIMARLRSDPHPNDYGLPVVYRNDDTDA